MITEFKLFERKGNYQLFHKTGSEHTLEEIIKDGFIRCGGAVESEDDDMAIWWNVQLRKNVIANWEPDNPKFKTISATRNLDYFDLPALELDVEKVSDRYKILPYIENLDYYGDHYHKLKLEPAKHKHLTQFQNMMMSKSPKAGEAYWRVKLNRDFDFGINEELILTDKLDVSKYVKRIILDKVDDKKRSKLIKEINEKYPHIEIVEIEDRKGEKGYADIKKAIRQKQNQKELIHQESYDYDDPRDDDPMNKYTEIIGYGKFISLFTIDWIEPTLRGLIRDDIDFDFYYSYDGSDYDYLIMLKGNWEDKIGNLHMLPSIDDDQWYISPLTGSDWYGSDWIRIDDVETFLDAKKYNL